jgi:hypothetical protein
MQFNLVTQISFILLLWNSWKALNLMKIIHLVSCLRIPSLNLILWTIYVASIKKDYKDIYSSKKNMMNVPFLLFNKLIKLTNSQKELNSLSSLKNSLKTNRKILFMQNKCRIRSRIWRISLKEKTKRRTIKFPKKNP